jgi:hypothetical protein
MREFPESDWKVLRAVKADALDRYCARVLDECRAAIDGKGSSHERYLRLFELLQERDETLSDAFDDMRRSTAYYGLTHLRNLGLLTNDEFARFSPETREAVLLISGEYR